MRKNLRNVAIPGSGVPLSVFCSFKATVYLFILVINPIACLLGAINEQRKHGRYDGCENYRWLRHFASILTQFVVIVGVTL